MGNESWGTARTYFLPDVALQSMFGPSRMKLAAHFFAPTLALALAACNGKPNHNHSTPTLSTNAASASHAHTNRLAREKSPYLLQHAHNPVDWFAWGEEAFAKARAENKPIFLSIGYSTCHWCHVMERESFESEEIGALPQRTFRQHQGGPRGAARRGQDLHDVRAVHDRLGRLAAECFPHAGSQAVLRRHVFPAGRSLWSRQFLVGA